MNLIVNQKMPVRTELADIQSLFTSAEFKSQLIKAYSSNVVARPVFQADDVETMFINLGRHIFREAKNAMRINSQNRGYALSMVNVPLEDLKRSIMAMAYYGLDLTPERQHVYFQPVINDITQIVGVSTILGVKGMSNLMSRVEGVRGVEARCFYKTDNFVFNGNFEKPTFSRSVFSGAQRDEDNIEGGYFLLHYVDGGVFCSDISGDRLREMAADARMRYLGHDGSINDETNPWFNSHKEVMFDHLVMRHGFRQVCDKTNLFALSLGERGDVLSVDVNATDGADDGFAETMREFSEALAQQSQGATVNVSV